MTTVTIIDNRARPARTGHFGGNQWQGDRAGLDALAELRLRIATAYFERLWSDDAEGGHPDPAVRDHARKVRRGQVWPDQLVDHRAPDNVAIFDREEAARIAEWSGWPELPKLRWGPCSTCANSDNGRERGYAYPCSPCKRPSHSHYLPAEHAGKTYELDDLLVTGFEGPGEMVALPSPLALVE